MPVYVPTSEAEVVLAKTLVKLRHEDAQRTFKPPKLDICSWMQNHYYIPETGRPIQLKDFQCAVLLYAFSRRNARFAIDEANGHFPFSTVVLSAIKKQGKTTLAGGISRWIAEDQTRYGTIQTMGNDAKQAKDRSFASVAQSIKLTPGYINRGNDGVLPDRWLVHETKLECLTSGSKIEAVSVDARGEAGANPDLTCWTELWGFTSTEAVRFYHEMTPPPTKADSIRLVETYAGFDGESMLLKDIYDRGMKGRQLTAGELADATGIALGCFEEAPHPDDLVPIWVNEAAGLFMYWDSGEQARRMEWQQGAIGDQYYREQEQELPPSQYQRIHRNVWGEGEGAFVPMELWDACYEEGLTMLEPGDRTPAILGVDAATTGDCFGIVLVTRHPVRHEDVAIRACRKWDPPKGGRIDYEGPEAFLRMLCKGGCMKGHPTTPPFFSSPGVCKHAPDAGRACIDCCPACRAISDGVPGALVPPYNITQITYDPYQLESMMQRFRKDGITWVKEFPQGGDRLEADKGLYDLIINRRLAHDGDTELRQHIANAAAQVAKHEDTKLRIVKKNTSGKIDLAVAASMACARCLYLRI